MSTRNQVMTDARSLHNELQRLGVDAGIDPKRCVPGGNQLAFYGVALRGKTKAADVARVLPELERTISRSRRTRTYLRFDDMLLRLEAEHPAKRPLQWLPSTMRRTKAHSASLGVSYHDGEQVASFSFDDVPQVLVAGETGSGKTVLVRNILTSLTYATSPDELRIVLIDPKNEDLLPYRDLPHTLMFAGMPADVSKAIERVTAEVQARVACPSRKTYRLLLVVDELAQLTNINGAIKQLGDIMSIGRSKLVNCLVCTQQPTEEGGMGSMMKANVPLRLIGAVSAGQSYTATRRRNAQADMLPGNGAFLFLKGMEMYRFQSYFMDGRDEAHAVAMVRQRWGNKKREPHEPVQQQTQVLPVYEPLEPQREPVHEPVLNRSEPQFEPLFPLFDKRPLNDREAVQAWHMSDNLSKSELCRQIYGAKSGRYMEWLNDGLNRGEQLAANGGDKIIKLRKVG